MKNPLRMKKPALLLGSLGLGAGLMYFLDPDRGKRRRAMVRDRAVRLTNDTNKQLSRTAIDLRNRAKGVLFETGKLFDGQVLTDEELNDKIRSKLGRLTSHPHQIRTEVEDGNVTLKGFVLDDEEELVISGVGSISGVNEIENAMETHARDENFPKLLGAEKRRRTVLGRQKNWSPQTRILAAAAGGSLALLGAKKRNPVSSLMASAGLGLLARSALDRPISDLFPKGTNGKIEVHKSINIKAPREEVFEVFKHPRYFPYFMSHVQKVEQTEDNRYRWDIDGIPGFPVNWETEVTEIKPNEMIRWKNITDSKKAQSGELTLESVGDGTTRVHIGMDYQPTGGKLGHFVARILRRDPKSELDDDLVRLKTFIEKGKLPHDAAANARRRNDMKVKEIMTENPVFATINMSLHDVAQRMNEYDVGSLPVIESEEDKTPVGIITDRDIIVRTIAHNQNPMQKIAGEVMTENAISVMPETSVEDCCNKMEINQIRRLLVVDEEGKLKGIVAQADIARKAPPFETAELVKDVSSPKLAASA